jgi:predicted DNA-binding transcriptional regulator AlpA
MMRARTAAEYCDVSEATFYQWVKKGDAPKSIRRGGVVFWRKHDLDQMICAFDTDGAPKQRLGKFGNV